LSDINFVTADTETILNTLIAQFETAYGQTFYPGDERRIFLQQLAQVIVVLKNDINQSARQNLLRYASGDMLDALGEFFNTDRIPAQKAKVTLRFTLSSAQALPVTIPAGTRMTPDGQLYFATLQDLIIPIGQTQGDVTAEAAEGGVKYNGFAPGQIKNIVDPVPYVQSVSNTDTSSGGSDIETDDNYRERIRLAPESYSVAGPEGAYIYWAKTADINISDVVVSSPSPGVVKVTVLMKDGQLPTQTVLDAVAAAVNSKERRPLTDQVQVAAPTEVAYNITLTYYISSDRPAEETSIRNAIEGSGGAIDQYKAWQCAKLGRAINPDYLKQLMLIAGAYRVDITAPVYTAINADQVPKVGTTTLNYGGLI
jgi:phage-related baseplate assembly protein